MTTVIGATSATSATDATVEPTPAVRAGQAFLRIAANDERFRAGLDAARHRLRVFGEVTRHLPLTPAAAFSAVLDRLSPGLRAATGVSLLGPVRSCLSPDLLAAMDRAAASFAGIPAEVMRAVPADLGCGVGAALLADLEAAAG